MAQQDMGLFGPSAAEVQRALDDRARLSNLEQAKLDPYQSIRLSMANYGTAAGKAIGGLFGIEDPALKEATQMDELKKAVASQWDGSDPEKALELFVQEANKRGFTSQALKASEKLTDLKMKKEEKEAIIGLRKAQTTEAQRKGEAAGQEKRPEFVRLQEERNRLQQLFNMSTDDAEKEALAAQIAEISKYLGKQSSFAPTAPKEDKSLIKVGVSTAGQIVYLNPNTNKQVIIDAKGEQVPYSGAVRESSGTTVNVNTAQESEFLKQLGKTDADTLQKARVLRQSAIGELENLNAMAERNAQGVTSGSFASGRVGVANFLNTIGLLGSADVQKLANSENFIKQAGDLVLSKIKPLGTQPSSSDRDFILKIIPQLENSPQARAQLITFLQNKANKTIKEVNSMEQYALTSKKGLSGYVPTTPLTISPQPTKDVTKMTDQELIDAYRSGRR